MTGTARAWMLLGLGLTAAWALSACATAPESEFGSRGARASDDEQALAELMPRDQWLRGIESKLTEGLCSDGQLFRACYEVSMNDCQETAARVATSCEARFEDIIPESISPEQGKLWGQEFGKCTGEQLYEALDAEYTFNETERCKSSLAAM